MAIIKLQGSHEHQAGIYYQFDTTSRLLGEGGMGKVYRGLRVDINTGSTREVAIKFMFEGLPSTVIERARREASIQLRNDNLVEMMGFVTTEHADPASGVVRKRYHVVSELLHGVTLADLLNGLVTDADGHVIPFAQKLYQFYQEQPCAFAVYVIRQVLSGLMALHDNGYIHRDIDPTNIMVTSDEKIKLIDFGIAKKIDCLTTSDKGLTSTGQFMGKAQYAAPELVLGDLPSQDRRTDIYAVGILLYQLITGVVPFTGTMQDVIADQLNKRISLGLIPNRQLGKIIRKATQKDRDKRYQSAEEFRVAINQLPDNPDDPVSPVKRWLAIGTGGVVLFLGLLLVIGLCLDDDDQPSDRTGFATEYATICSQLKDRNTAPEAFDHLQKLMEKPDSTNSPAIYLLSRLYFPAHDATELDDSIRLMQQNLGERVKQDARRAHDLLKLTVSADSTCYPALFELALDYHAGPDRTGDEAADQKLALSYLKKARQQATAQYDAAFARNCQSWVDKVGKLQSEPQLSAPTQTPKAKSKTKSAKKTRQRATYQGRATRSTQSRPTPQPAKKRDQMIDDLNRLLK